MGCIYRLHVYEKEPRWMDSHQILAGDLLTCSYRSLCYAL
jgi:hypothetical protein